MTSHAWMDRVPLTERLLAESRQLPDNWDEVAATWRNVYGQEPPVSARRLFPWTEASEDEVCRFAATYDDARQSVTAAYIATGNTGRPSQMQPHRLWELRDDPERMMRHTEREMRFAASKARANDPAREARRELALDREVERYLAAEAERERREREWEREFDLRNELAAIDDGIAADEEWEISVFGEVVTQRRADGLALNRRF